MLLRCCVDLISNSSLWLRPFVALRSQTLGYSTDDPSLTKPKRNKNPWVFYFMEHIPQAQAENPGTSSPKLFQMLSVKWQSLSQEAQKKYLDLAADDKTRYDEEIRAYKAKLTPAKILEISKEKEKIRLQKSQMLEKKKLKALGIPKRPPNAYILFSKDFMRNKFLERPEGTKFDIKKQALLVSDAWSKLSVDEKAKWDELAASKTQEFKKKVEEWESEMASKGYLEIVDNSKT